MQQKQNKDKGHFLRFRVLFHQNECDISDKDQILGRSHDRGETRNEETKCGAVSPSAKDDEESP